MKYGLLSCLMKISIILWLNHVNSFSYFHHRSFLKKSSSCMNTKVINRLLSLELSRTIHNVENDENRVKPGIRTQNMISKVAKNIPFGQQLRNYIDNKDAEGFTAVLKKASYSFQHFINNIVFNEFVLYVDEMFKISHDNPAYISTWLLCISRGGVFIHRNPVHKKFFTTLFEQLLNCPQVTSRDITTALTALPRLGFSDKYLSSSLRMKMYQVIEKTSYTVNAREVGNMIYSLCKLKTLWTSLSTKTHNNIMHKVSLSKKELMNVQGSMFIYGMGLMGAKFDDLMPKFKSNLLEICKGIIMLNESTQQCSNVFYGLAKMEMKFQDIPSDTIKTIDDALVASLPISNDQELTNTIYSLGLIGYPWSTLSSTAQTAIYETILNRSLVIQGLSTLVYGMNLMNARWHDAPLSYRLTIQKSIIQHFNSTCSPGNSQAIGNILYSLEQVGATWDELDRMTQVALLNAFVQYMDEMSSQEFCNSIYGLGGMKMPYAILSHTGSNNMIMNRINKKIDEIRTDMGEKEITSLCYGFTNMGAKWGNLPSNFKPEILSLPTKSSTTSSLYKLSELGLSSLLYSLGSFEADWNELPTELKDFIFVSMLSLNLTDSYQSNVIYGFGLSKVDWFEIPEQNRNYLYQLLSIPNTMNHFKAQHISNTLWGLAKMEATWQHLPAKEIEILFRDAQPFMLIEEFGMSVYGLGLLDFSWSSLDYKTKLAIYEGIMIYARSEIDSTQEHVNFMYSMSLLSFDSLLNLDAYCDTHGIELNPDHTRPKSVEELLLSIHHQLLHLLANARSSMLEPAMNREQCGLYLTTLASIPNGRKLIDKYFDTVPLISGPKPDIPSRMHADVIQTTITQLNHNHQRNEYEVVNEFPGLPQGSFPLDAAIYYQKELVAFIEIDGEFHYKQLGEKLRRKDRLKEYLYKQFYPTVPLYRIRYDQCTAIGVTRAGMALAEWISSLTGRPLVKPPPS